MGEQPGDVDEARKKLGLQEAQLKELRAFVSGSATGVAVTCDHTHALTEEWAGRMMMDVEAVVEGVKVFGGDCDCKIGANVTPEKFGW